MKKSFFVLILASLFLVKPMNGQQNYEELIDGCGAVIDDKNYNPDQVLIFELNGESDNKIPFTMVKSIYDLDVISRYHIKGYNTDLQKEMFKESDEYKELEKTLKEERELIKNTTFYYIHKLNSNYNLEKAGFAYDIELYEGSYKEFPGFINHGTLCVEYATKRFPKNKIEVIKRWGGSDYFYNQRVYLQVKDKQTALKIEQAGNNKGVLFLFKIDSVNTAKTWIFNKNFALTKTEGIYIINTQTGEIYCKVL